MARGKPLPREQQVAIFRRARWICHWCGRPVIFAPALKYLEREMRERGHDGKFVYFHPNELIMVGTGPPCAWPFTCE